MSFTTEKSNNKLKVKGGELMLEFFTKDSLKLIYKIPTFPFKLDENLADRLMKWAEECY